MLERNRQNIIDPADWTYIQTLFDVLGNIHEIPGIFLGDQYRFYPSPVGRQQLFFQAANG